MRPTLSLKTLLRAPFKTFLTFLLIAAASFGLFYRVADYAVTQRETARAVSWYRGVAAFDNGVPNMAQVIFSQLPNSLKGSYYKDTHPWPSPLTAEQIGAFSAMPGVSSTDTRYLTSGVIDGLERVVEYGPYAVRWNYPARFVVEGTYAGHTTEITNDGNSNENWLHLTDCKPLAGGIPLKQGDDVNIVAIARDGYNFFSVWSESMRPFAGLRENPFGQSFVDTLTGYEGERCVVIGRWDPIHSAETNTLTLYIGDQDTLDYCDSFWRLDGKPENYLETKELARVREIVDITNRDLKTFDMVYTSDMLAIPRFNERKMIIQEGRELTEADTNACVANALLMELNGLKVGDKLTVELCDKLLPQHAEMGATAVIPERYGVAVKTVELEIVGSYTDTDPQYARNADAWWSYSPNTIFVPSSLLPIEVPDGYGIRPAEFSIVIDDAAMIEQFLNAAKPLAKDMGIKQLLFSDRGWMKVKDSVNINQTMSLITTALYTAAAAVALILAAYLYIGRNKKNYAIMRALGTPRNRAQNALALPLAVLSVLAIPVGGVTGMIYAHKAIATALESMAEAMEQYIPDASLPVGTMLLCLLCEAGFLVLISALFLRKLAKTPPLALLQDNAVCVKAKKANTKTTQTKTQPETAPPPEFVLAFPIGSDLPKRGGYGAARHVSRYILRHMRRAGGKTALALLLAVLLTGAIGLLAVTRLSYKEMFDQTVVTGTISNYPSSSVMEAQRSEHMKNFYYSGEFSVIANNKFSSLLLAFTNDIERYLQSRYEYGYSIDYAEGYDSSLFSQNEPLCLIGCSMADEFGVKPGDSITLLEMEHFNVLSDLYENEDERIARLKQDNREFKVAGVITPEDGLSEFRRRNVIGGMAISLFAPLSTAAEEISPYIEDPFLVEYGEYTLVDKENPYVLRDYLGKLASVDHKYDGDVTYDLNTTELDNIKRIRDMLNLLFPIAAAVAILIGLIAPGLIITQSAKEAATLRVLGTTKLRTRCMLAIEQASLCVFGLVIAALGLMIYSPGLFERSAGTQMLCGGLYLLGCVCAATFAAAEVTRRKVLELLQVKE